MLKRKGQSFKEVVAVLEGQSTSTQGDVTSILICPEFRDNIGDDDEHEEEQGEEAQPPLQKMILDQLIAFLAGYEA
jgi:hypothetical protein